MANVDFGRFLQVLAADKFAKNRKVLEYSCCSFSYGRSRGRAQFMARIAQVVVQIL